MEGVRSRFRGAVLGLAIGDALGMPYEGWDPASIKGSLGKLEFKPAPFRGLASGQFTDDTKMALCHLDSLIEKRRVDAEDIARKFLAWFKSGDWRGIGGTTLRAMKKLEKGASWKESGISGKYAAGNGGAMRIAPVGLFYTKDIENLREGVEKAVIITHNNEEAVEGAVAIAYLVARGAEKGIFDEKERFGLFSELLEFLKPSEVKGNLVEAFDLLKENFPPSEAARVLGNSGYVVESVASAVYSFFYSPHDFKKAVFEALLCGGDTDTICAMTGAISGAFLGEESIPFELRHGVEAHSEFIKKADELYEVWREKFS
jgi:ADP-ribosylglycohydrolase